MTGTLMRVLALAISVLCVTARANDETVRAAFITLGEPGKDAIGPYINAVSVGQSLAKLPTNDPVDVLVFRINSTGGLLAEVPRLSDLIESRKETSRVVVWVDRALSAAALSSLTSATIVMSPEGTIGSAVTFVRRQGRAEALAGEDLEKALAVGAAIAARGKHEPLLVKAMQTPIAVSCDLGAAGPVNFREDETGTEIVNKEGEILTLTAQQAVRFGLADGIAGSEEELMKVLGYAEWKDVGAEADADQVKYRADVQAADLNLQERRVRRDEALQKVRDSATPEDKKAAAKVAGRLDAEIGLIFRQYPALREYYGAVAADDIVPPGTPRKLPVSDKPMTVPTTPSQR